MDWNQYTSEEWQAMSDNNKVKVLLDTCVGISDEDICSIANTHAPDILGHRGLTTAEVTNAITNSTREKILLHLTADQNAQFSKMLALMDATGLDPLSPHGAQFCQVLKAQGFLVDDDIISLSAACQQGEVVAAGEPPVKEYWGWVDARLTPEWIAKVRYEIEHANDPPPEEPVEETPVEDPQSPEDGA